MEVEGAIVPPKIRLSHYIRRYALRLLKLSETHPVNAKLAQIRDSEFLFNYSSDTSAMESRLKKNSKKTLQIRRITSSIKLELVDAHLENIVNSYYPPWDRDIHYSVEISLESKEEAAKLHNSYLNSLCNQALINSVYTDASKLSEIEAVGISLVVYNHSVPFIPAVASYSENWNLGSHVIVYDGELEAVTRAIEYIASVAKRGEYYNIFNNN